MPRKPKVKYRTAELRLMETMLAERDFDSRDRVKFDRECEKDSSETKWASPPRFTYRKGSWRLLTESLDQPFWTIQRVRSGHVVWFLDVPFDAGADTCFRFMEAADA